MAFLQITTHYVLQSKKVDFSSASKVLELNSFCTSITFIPFIIVNDVYHDRFDQQQNLLIAYFHGSNGSKNPFHYSFFYRSSDRNKKNPQENIESKI